MLSVWFSWRRSYVFIVLATLSVVATADFLLYGHTLGWTASAVAGALLAAIALRNTAFLRTNGGRIFALAAIGLLFALVEEPTWLNITYVLVCLAALAMVNSMGWEPNFWPWLQRTGRWLAIGWVRLFLDNGLVGRFLVRRGFSLRSARGIAAWIVPALLSSVFVGIFAFANPIIAEWLSRGCDWLGRMLQNLPDLLDATRLLFWLAFATGTWMLLRGRARRWRTKRLTISQFSRGSGGTDGSDGREGGGDEITWNDAVEHRRGRMYVPPAFVVRCLLLFNLVFVVENVLDLRYLSDPSKLPPGMSYTEYVHRGAYPLIGAALLAGAFVLLTFRPGSETERSRAARLLVYAWIGQTILLTLSAAWRLGVYVQRYELTRLRLASAIWFLVVALGLFFIIWRIVRGRSNSWLVNVNALSALVILYPCCFVNFDGYIADFNADHCAEAGGPGIGLDIEYLYHLGTPALPALDRMTDRIALEPRRKLAQRMSSDLHRQLDSELSDWHSWTWRRQRSERAAMEVAQAKTRATPQLAQATPADPIR